MGNDVSTVAGGAATAVTGAAAAITFGQVKALNGTVFREHFLNKNGRSSSFLVKHVRSIY